MGWVWVWQIVFGCGQCESMVDFSDFLSIHSDVCFLPSHCASCLCWICCPSIKRVLLKVKSPGVRTLAQVACPDVGSISPYSVTEDATLPNVAYPNFANISLVQCIMGKDLCLKGTPQFKGYRSLCTMLQSAKPLSNWPSGRIPFHAVLHRAGDFNGKWHTLLLYNDRSVWTLGLNQVEVTIPHPNWILFGSSGTGQVRQRTLFWQYWGIRNYSNA